MKATTVGQLKSSGYHEISIHEEVRNNLMNMIQGKEERFQGVLGYDFSVLPQVESALLAKHNILLLGLRGQAKTRIARSMTDLLNAEVPVLADTPFPDSPFQPVSAEGKRILEIEGDNAKITWLKAEDRYVEKLATPDVSVADLIGDVDPIKASTLGLPYSDERSIHFGLIPNSNKSIFVINELPDLQARIQVALFDILSEGDIQIRGFKRRMPLDILFVFTANPEDYTNRGNIITPLKDRIQAQILTHYPETTEISKIITKQEAHLAKEHSNITVSDSIHDIIEEVAVVARDSEYVDSNSGVSARMTISAYEILYSSIERRMLISGETTATARPTDVFSILPAVCGKMELVYEGEQMGAELVATHLIGKAIEQAFKSVFPDPRYASKLADGNPYEQITEWFENGAGLELEFGDSDQDRNEVLNSVEGLQELILNHCEANSQTEQIFYKELALLGLQASGKLELILNRGNILISDPVRSALGDDELDLGDLLK